MTASGLLVLSRQPLGDSKYKMIITATVPIVAIIDTRLRYTHTRSITLHAPTWISNAHGAYSKVLSTGCTQLNVVASVMVYSSLGQHSVILDFTLPTQNKWKM